MLAELVGRATIWGRQLAPPTRLHPNTHTPFSPSVPKDRVTDTEQQCELGGNLVYSKWTCPPCIPVPSTEPTRHPADSSVALQPKSRLCRMLAVQPRASALASLSFSLLIHKGDGCHTHVVGIKVVRVAHLA